MPQPVKILVLNAGSSSDKCSLFAVDARSVDEAPRPLWTANIAWKSKTDGQVVIKCKGSQSNEYERSFSSREAALTDLLQSMWKGDSRVLDAASDVHFVGHRIVHGGPRFDTSVKVDAGVKEYLRGIVDLAPTHMPANLLGIEVAERLCKDSTQIAVFDTSFHATMPEEAKIYPLPYEWYQDMQIRRYGFHGINHKYCTQLAQRLLKGNVSRLITCHLGAGCSLAAVKDGKSVMTTMGYTPLEGTMMASRSGSIDPGIIFHLLNQHAQTAEQLYKTLNENSGLKGVSGISKDLREVMHAADLGDERASLAVQLFVRSVSANLCSLLPNLGGLDAIVFTAGIAEHSARIRQAVCRRLGFLGLEIDDELNENGKGDRLISAPQSRIAALVVAAQEEWAIAREIFAMVD
jgi:acetate kinase